MERRLEADDGSKSHVTQWASLNPVVPHGLLQLTCGTPGIVYHVSCAHCSPGLAERAGLSAFLCSISIRNLLHVPQRLICADRAA